MTPDLKQIQCDDMCGFMVRSHDEYEVIQLARQHIKNAHKMDVSEADLKSKIKTVSEPVASAH